MLRLGPGRWTISSSTVLRVRANQGGRITLHPTLFGNQLELGGTDTMASPTSSLTTSTETDLLTYPSLPYSTGSTATLPEFLSREDSFNWWLDESSLPLTFNPLNGSLPPAPSTSMPSFDDLAREIHESSSCPAEVPGMSPSEQLSTPELLPLHLLDDPHSPTWICEAWETLPPMTPTISDWDLPMELMNTRMTSPPRLIRTRPIRRIIPDPVSDSDTESTEPYTYDV